MSYISAKFCLCFTGKWPQGEGYNRGGSLHRNYTPEGCHIRGISELYPSCILSFTKALSRNNLTKMLSSSYIDEYHVILQVLGSHHFHLLAFHVIQGNQVIVRGEKRKTVESVLNCLKVSYIEMKHFRTHRHSSVSPFVR